MMVKEVRAKAIMAEPGVYGYDAEAVVYDGGKTVFVHANLFDGSISFAVYEKSVFDYVTGQSDEEYDERAVEEYSSISDAKGSRFVRVFMVLDQVIALMESGVTV